MHRRSDTARPIPNSRSGGCSFAQITERLDASVEQLAQQRDVTNVFLA